MTVVRKFCEGCDADRCLACLMRMRPCDTCGQTVSIGRVREAMDSVSVRVSRWTLASSELPEYRCPVRVEVYQRWVAFLNPPVASPAASATAATSTDAAGSMATAAAGVPRTKSAGAGAEAAAGSVPPAAQQRRQPEKTPPTMRRETEPLEEGIDFESTVGAAAAAAAGGGRGEGGQGRESSADRLAIGAEAEAAQVSPADKFGGGEAAGAAVDRDGREESKEGERGTGSGGAAGASGDAPIGRAPLGEVQYMESLKTANLASVEGVKLFFSRWVEPDVVDLYHESTGDINTTIAQCHETVLQVLAQENKSKAAAPAAAEPPPSSPAPAPKPLPAPAKAATGLGAGGARAGKEEEKQAGSRDKGVVAGAAAAVPTVSLEEQMAELQEAEKRNQAARTERASRRAEEAAAEREDREMQEAVAREEAAARRKEAAAAAARSKAEGAAGEAARIAEAKAATEASRAMAAAAELEASEAAKRKAKEEEEEKEEERKAKKDAAATAAPPGAKRQEHIVAPVPERGTSGERVATGLSGATAGPPAMTGGGSGGGGGGASLVVDMSLEVRLKKAIERGNALAVQAIHDEADQTPGADMKKIKKKCKKWLSKKEGEMREEQQRLLQANQPPLNPALGLRQAGPGFGVPTPPVAVAAAAQSPTQYEMFCPNVIAGQVIGRGGQTVNRLMKESRARIVLKTYADKTGHDVVITGSPQATGRRLVEDFYRSKGIEPTLLQPPSSAIAAAAAAAAAAAGRPGGVAPRARLPDPMMPTEAMIGHLGRGRTMAGAGPAAAAAAAGMLAPSGAIPQGARPVAQPVAQPVMYGGGHGGGGGGGGGVDVSGGELPQLLRAARCEHHLERFQRDQLDGEVLLEMERRDFDRMGVTESEQSRILSALKHAGEGGGGGGGPGAAGRRENSAQRVVTVVRGTSGGVATPVEVEDDDDDDDDSDGLDPDHPDTCKICMDALVGILFLPCAHQCTCVRCGSGFVGKPCIICRQKVTRAQPVIRLRR
ncbi:unnamed protein product [Ectocarpus sp. 12 AP-2014]